MHGLHLGSEKGHAPGAFAGMAFTGNVQPSLVSMVTCREHFSFPGRKMVAAGGRGGCGGDVVLRASQHVAGLYCVPAVVAGGRGGRGGSRGETGARGADRVLEVPVGTTVRVLQAALGQRRGAGGQLGLASGEGRLGEGVELQGVGVRGLEGEGGEEGEEEEEEGGERLDGAEGEEEGPGEGEEEAEDEGEENEELAEVEVEMERHGQQVGTSRHHLVCWT